MNRCLCHAVVLLILVALFPSPVRAVPGQMTYTGYLEKGGKPFSSGGVPLTATFKIFSSLAGGIVPLWQGAHKVTVANGVFHVTLGEKTLLSPKVFDGSARYLEIVLGAQTMSPRVPLRTVPYAFTAENCIGNITPKSVTVNGKTVVNSSGTWVGALGSNSEKDPHFAGSAAAKISSADTGNWKAAHGWGDHCKAGYLKVEVDPNFAASAAAKISSADTGNWKAAHGWGDHAKAGYVKQGGNAAVQSLTLGNTSSAGTLGMTGKYWELSISKNDTTWHTIAKLGCHSLVKLMVYGSHSNHYQPFEVYFMRAYCTYVPSMTLISIPTIHSASADLQFQITATGEIQVAKKKPTYANWVTVAPPVMLKGTITRIAPK